MSKEKLHVTVIYRFGSFKRFMYFQRDNHGKSNVISLLSWRRDDRSTIPVDVKTLKQNFAHVRYSLRSLKQPTNRCFFILQFYFKCSWWGILPLWTRRATANSRTNLETTSRVEPVNGFCNVFIKMFLWWPCAKIAERSTSLKKMAPRAKIEKSIQTISLNQRTGFEILSQEWTRVILYQTPTPAIKVDEFCNNFIIMILAKIAPQTVLLRWTIWPPELKTVKSFKWLLLLNGFRN